MDEPELTPDVVTPSIEEQATEMGWKPLDQYEGDPKKWVSADTFVARKPLFEKIEETSRHNKDLRRKVDTLEMSMQELRAHNERIREMEYKRALEDLKQQRRQALANDDHLLAEDLQEQIETVKETSKPVAVTPKPSDPPTVFVEWAAENEWYKLDPELREFADAYGIVLHNKGQSPEEVLRGITQRVRKQFPEKFRNPMKDKASPVETQPAVGPSRKGSTYKPTQMEREMAKRFVDTGAFKTVEDYYKQLADLQELE